MTTEWITTETPKRTKIVEAIIALLALRKADKDFDDAVKRIKSSCHNNLSGELSCSDQELVAVSTKLNAAAIKLNSLKSAKPKAEKLIEFGKKVGGAGWCKSVSVICLSVPRLAPSGVRRSEGERSEPSAAEPRRGQGAPRAKSWSRAGHIGFLLGCRKHNQHIQPHDPPNQS